MSLMTIVDSAALFVCLAFYFLPQTVANLYLRPTVSSGMQIHFIFAFLRFTIDDGVSPTPTFRWFCNHKAPAFEMRV